MNVTRYDGVDEDEKFFATGREARAALAEQMLRPEVESVTLRKMAALKKRDKTKRRRKAQRAARRRNR